MITTLSPNISKFTHIVHVADLHIRLNKRHDEYREVFKELYSEIEKTPETTIIGVLGDIFHSKSDLSPECIQMAYDLFTNLTRLRPVILISGNHDATLSNKNRLDSLTPIIDALNIPNLYYLKDTGLYGFGNILFNNMSVFDTPDKYIRGNDIPKIYRNEYERVIALYHGPIDGAATDTGYRISNPSVMIPLFDNHDIVLLGDIHKAQDMQDHDSDEQKPCIRYPGSTIQQNHGENLTGHGYSLWELADNSYVHRELKNKYGYFTIEIHKGKLVTDLSEIPSLVRLRVKCFESIATEIKSIMSDIKSKVDVVEVSYVRVQQDISNKNLIPIFNNISLTNLSTLSYQEKLLSEYLQKKTEIVNVNFIDEILKINKEINSIITPDDVTRSLKWKPIKFEFDNMFTYGEKNVIDFTKLDGVYGIFGPNASGKSSILSAMTFCLFDKFDRGFKGILVRHSDTSSFTCKFEFEISGVRYFISKTGNTTRTGNVKVNVEFWRVVDGVVEELHGNARRNTNEVIRDYVGTYEDFILTTLSIQSGKNNVSFIDMGHTERKDLLVQFLGLNIFDKLHDCAAEKNKELTTILKIHKDKNYIDELSTNTNALSTDEVLFNNETELVNSLQKQLTDLNEEIISESAKLIRLEDDTPTNLESISNKKTTIVSNITEIKKIISRDKLSAETKSKEIEKIVSEIEEIESSNFSESHKEYKSLLQELSDKNKEIELKKVDVLNKLDKQARLANHKYDPNCKYCIDNDFVKDALNATEELIGDKKITKEMMAVQGDLTKKIKKLKWVEDTYNKYTLLLTKRNEVKDEYSELTHKLMVSKTQLEKFEGELKTATKQIELYNRNEISVQHNEKINFNIAAFRKSKENLTLEFQTHNKNMMLIGNRIATCKSKIEELKKTIETLKSVEDKCFYYKHYMDAIGRDGIPYQVICNTVPEIEREINSILSQVVGYSIEIETDGKNVIPYIVYDERKWPIEMASGFERFVASIAIRVALSEISNLPKTNNLQIDEGFGSLDADNMSAMSVLFSTLKSKFDFMFVVSHIDALKDAVDHQIEISREGNFSKIIV